MLLFFTYSVDFFNMSPVNLLNTISFCYLDDDIKSFNMKWSSFKSSTGLASFLYPTNTTSSIDIFS